MHILIASPYLPWPLNSGGNAAQFSTLKCLAEDHRFTLVCPVYDEGGVENARELQSHLPQVTVRTAFCGSPLQTPIPEPGLLVRAARWMVRQGRNLLNPPASLPKLPPVKPETPYYPFNPLPENFITALQEELSKGTDLFQAEFAEMLPLGSWLPPQIPKLFINHQVHFVYANRILQTQEKNSYSSYLAAVMQIQEQAYLQNFDGIITFSEEDRKALLPHVTPEKLFTSPFPLPADVGIADKLPPTFDGRFLFLASEEHNPNRDALEWLLTKIWPEILRQLPMSRLVIIGRWSTDAQARWKVPGIVFLGFANDLSAALRGGIMLVPLRVGSGIRVKIMVAMAQGAPVVSTSVGCEGMPICDGKELLVRDDPSEFAAAAVRLAREPELWKKLAEAGRSAISKHYSPASVRQRRNEIYATLTQHRQNLLTAV